MAVSRINEAGLNINQYGNRNLLINGAMQVYQRGAGTYTNNAFSLDRWKFVVSGADQAAGTITQDSDAPDGFANSLKFTTTTAETAWANDEYAYLNQNIEAQNLQQLAYGTSSAKQLTMSFYVKSSVTGTFALSLYKNDNTAQINNKTYTINSANTWEFKTITFEANTLSGGAINDDNGLGFYVNWHLAAGSDYTGGGSLSGWTNYGGNTYWADGQATNVLFTTNSSTWQLTGCQLEVGDTATDFEHRTFADELARCQRYYHKIKADDSYMRFCNGFYYATTAAESIFNLPVTMRVEPSLESTGTASDYAYYDGVGVKSCSNLILNAGSNNNSMTLQSVAGSTTQGFGAVLIANNNTDAFIAASAEL